MGGVFGLSCCYVRVLLCIFYIGGRKMADRGHPGRGGRGACGGTRRRDGSGRGVGNRGTSRQPKK